MIRRLYWLIAACAPLAACSFTHDFDGYRFELDASDEGPDDRRKPGRSDAGAGDAQTDAQASQDSAPAPDAAPDAGRVEPADGAVDGAPEGGSAPDAGSPDDASAPEGIEGTWDVQLRLTSESCPGHAPLDADTWTLDVAGAGVGELSSSAWQLAGQLELEAGRYVRGTFSGFTAGAGGGRTQWELIVREKGATLAGEMQQTAIYADGGIGCAVRREITGTR